MSTQEYLSLADIEALDQPRGSGTEKIARCPVCQSTERAFHFNSETGAYNCKRASCGTTGKLRDFWTPRENRPQHSRKQRARMALNEAFRLDPILNAPAAPIAPQTSSTAATWHEHWQMAQPLTGTAQAEYLSGRGVPEAVATAAGVRALTLHRRHYVVFPFRDQDGAQVSFQARAIDAAPDGHRAYGSKRNAIFQTAPDALRIEPVIICEAPIDALTLAALGYPAIALGGTAAPSWLALALAFKKVLLALDNDSNGAGDQAAAALIPALQSFGARPARLRPYRQAGATKSDWNGMMREGNFRAWLSGRIAQIEYFQWR